LKDTADGITIRDEQQTLFHGSTSELASDIEYLTSANHATWDPAHMGLIISKSHIAY